MELPSFLVALALLATVPLGSTGAEARDGAPVQTTCLQSPPSPASDGRPEAQATCLVRLNEVAVPGVIRFDGEGKTISVGVKLDDGTNVCYTVDPAFARLVYECVIDCRFVPADDQEPALACKLPADILP